LSEHTTTDCLLFPDIFDRPLVAKFDQQQGSSDGGAILLKAAERRLGLTSALAAGLRDDRQPGKVQHELRELLTQRVMAIALGYEDANDAARLASDPIHKLLVGRDSVPSLVVYKLDPLVLVQLRDHVSRRIEVVQNWVVASKSLEVGSGCLCA
jgi:hypothetical protein